MRRPRGLEQAIEANPYEPEPYLVLADWLQAQGDPRGELIALQIKKPRLAAAFLAKHEDLIVDFTADGKCPDGTDRDAFEWKFGFIHKARLSYHRAEDTTEFDGTLADVLERLLDHPSGRFLAELTLNYNGDPDADTLDDVLEVLVKKPRPAIRALVIGDAVEIVSQFNIGDLSKIWRALPNLQVLGIKGVEFELGTMVAPALEYATIMTSGMSEDNGDALAAAELPRIKHLDLWYGGPALYYSSIEQVTALLARGDLPRLKRLGLRNAVYANEICEALVGARLLPQLEALDLSMGCMTDEGAACLKANTRALAHLGELDVSHNYLTKRGIAALKQLAKKVITAEQQTPGADGTMYAALWSVL